jgi:hypothetical protein
MIYIKSHKTDEGLILAMCDESLIGSVLDDGKMFIDIKRYADFYVGELVDKAKAKELISPEKISSVNVIGEEAIQVAISNSVISKDNVKSIKGVPYAQAYKVDY